MNKPGKSFPRPLADLLHKTLTDAFAKQGFASSELVTRWADIVGAEIAAHSEPEKMKWTRGADGHAPEPGTLVLRVEGPTAIEIQHLFAVASKRRSAPAIPKRRRASRPVSPKSRTKNCAPRSAGWGRPSNSRDRKALAGPLAIATFAV